MSALKRNPDWTPGLWWVRDPAGGRLHLCTVGEGKDFNSGRTYKYASSVYPLGVRFWTELDDPDILGSKVEVPERV